MDICAHPQSIALHGALSGKNPHVTDLTPIFSLSKTTMHSDILGVPVEQYADSLPHVPWDQRREEAILWRGSNTGAHYEEGTPWAASHRIRLIELGMRKKGEITLLSPSKDKIGKIKDTWIKEKFSDVNKWFTDMKFTGEPIRECARLSRCLCPAPR